MNFSLPGEELRSWRENHNLTQDEFGSLLGISREWIGKLETGKRPASAEVFLRFQALRREPKFSSGEVQERPQESAGAVQASANPSPSVAGQLRIDISAAIDAVIKAAGTDVGRLGWIREQLNRHLATPTHWKDELSPGSDDPNLLSPLHAKVEREVLAKMRRKERGVQQRAKFVQSSDAKAQGGAGR